MIESLTRLAQVSAAIGALMLSSGCAYQGRSIEQHFLMYAAVLPEKNKFCVQRLCMPDPDGVQVHA